MTEWQASWTIGRRGCAGVMLFAALLLFPVVSCNSSGPSAPVPSDSRSQTNPVAAGPSAAPIADRDSATIAPPDIAARLAMQECVLPFGLPDLVLEYSEGCIGWAFTPEHPGEADEHLSMGRRRFFYLSLNQLVVVNKGEIVELRALSNSDRAFVQNDVWRVVK